MTAWSNKIVQWVRVALPSFSHHQPTPITHLQPVHSVDVARRAIGMLKEAELDFHRCGQLALSRVYRDRAAALERELGADATRSASQRR